MKKTLRRISPLFLTMVLVLVFLAACGGTQQKVENPYVGTWPAFALSAEGMTVSFDRNDTKGIVMTLLEDGKTEFKVGDQTETGKWTETDTGVEIESGGMKMPGTLEDGVLSFDLDGAQMFCHKLDAEVTAKEQEIVDGATMNMKVEQIMEFMQ